MKGKMKARPIFLVMAISAAAILPCAHSASKISGAATAGGPGGHEKVDFDLVRMNRTMQATYVYRLAANPKEFAGRTMRVSGTFATVLDEESGKRLFGCFMDAPGGCACCAPGGVLEFVPKDSYVWPTNFPPVESRVTVTGRLKMFDVGPQKQSVTIPRLVDADMSWDSR